MSTMMREVPLQVQDGSVLVIVAFTEPRAGAGCEQVRWQTVESDR